jgi:ribosomal protein L37AE/L43A
MANYHIKRQNLGKTPTKYGIVLKGLPPRHQRILKENPVVKKYADDDLFINAIFRIEDGRIRVSHLNRPFVQPGSKDISSYSSVKDSYKIFDWNCAYCNKEIQSRIDTYIPSNFTCEKCFKYYLKGTEKIDQRVIESSLAFTVKCKRMMIDNQKSFIKYIRKNEKPSRIL